MRGGKRNRRRRSLQIERQEGRKGDRRYKGFKERERVKRGRRQIESGNLTASDRRQKGREGDWRYKKDRKRKREREKRGRRQIETGEATAIDRRQKRREGDWKQKH